MPILPGDIKNVTLTEQGHVSVAGYLTPVMRATFHVRDHGPFSLHWPKTEYTPDKAEAEIVAYATEIVGTLEECPEIQRIGESFVLGAGNERLPSVNFVFTVGGKGRFETGVPRKDYTAKAGVAAIAKTTHSVTSLTDRFRG